MLAELVRSLEHDCSGRAHSGGRCGDHGSGRDGRGLRLRLRLRRARSSSALARSLVGVGVTVPGGLPDASRCCGERGTSWRWRGTSSRARGAMVAGCRCGCRFRRRPPRAGEELCGRWRGVSSRARGRDGRGLPLQPQAAAAGAGVVGVGAEPRRRWRWRDRAGRLAGRQQLLRRARSFVGVGAAPRHGRGARWSRSVTMAAAAGAGRGGRVRASSALARHLVTGAGRDDRGLPLQPQAAAAGEGVVGVGAEPRRRWRDRAGRLAGRQQLLRRARNFVGVSAAPRHGRGGAMVAVCRCSRRRPRRARASSALARHLVTGAGARWSRSAAAAAAAGAGCCGRARASSALASRLVTGAGAR
jgi:hypothetical protein